jgi:DNA polymerase III sliding clamp (beta) subunit (PCNA family)
MDWNSVLFRLSKLASLIAVERKESSGVHGVLHFLSDGYVWGRSESIGFETWYGGEVEAHVPASKFCDVVSVLNATLMYDVEVEQGNFVVKGKGFEARIRMVGEEVGDDGRVVKYLFEHRDELIGKKVFVDAREDLVKILKKVVKVSSTADAFSEYKSVCFDSRGIFSTDRSRVACCFIPVFDSRDKIIIPANVLRQVFSIMENERLVGAWVVSGKLYFEFDGGLYVEVISYDIDYPDLVSVLEKHKSKIKEIAGVDPDVMDRISNIVKVLDYSDVVCLKIENGVLSLEVDSVRGFKVREDLQHVKISERYDVGVRAKDLDVVDGIIELGMSEDVVYLKSSEGIEYLVATIVW